MGASAIGTVPRHVVDHTHRMLAHVGVDLPAVVPSGDERVPAAELYRLWQLAVDVSGDDALGFRTARAARAGRFGLLATVVWTSATVAEALIENSRVLPLISDSVSLTLIVRGESASYELGVREPELLHPQSAQQILGSIWFGLRRAVAPDASLGASLVFTHTAPADPDRHRRLAGCPVRFGGLVNAIELPTTDLLQPLRTGDHEANARSRAEAARHHRPRSAFVGHVRQVIRAELERGTLSEATVAAHLGLHPRTLSRRLVQRDTSFRALVDAERLTQARRLLVAGRAVEQVAHALGYSDGTAFARAFKRWTGSSPAAYRAGRA